MFNSLGCDFVVCWYLSLTLFACDCWLINLNVIVLLISVYCVVTFLRFICDFCFV